MTPHTLRPHAPASRSARRVLSALLPLLFAGSIHAQALPTAAGPGTYIAVGGAITAFQSDYGQRIIGGTTLFTDIQPHWSLGIEAETRHLHFHTDEGVTETDYLAGPRYVFHPWGLRPYVKMLAGAGRITLPFKYAQGTFFSYAPGAGLDYAVGDHLIWRVFDVEYQSWPSFGAYGSLHTYGLSTGISFRLNPVEIIPRYAYRFKGPHYIGPNEPDTYAPPRAPSLNGKRSREPDTYAPPRAPYLSGRGSGEPQTYAPPHPPY